MLNRILQLSDNESGDRNILLNKNKHFKFMLYNNVKFECKARNITPNYFLCDLALLLTFSFYACAFKCFWNKNYDVSEWTLYLLSFARITHRDKKHRTQN